MQYSDLLDSFSEKESKNLDESSERNILLTSTELLNLSASAEDLRSKIAVLRGVNYLHGVKIPPMSKRLFNHLNNQLKSTRIILSVLSRKVRIRELDDYVSQDAQNLSNFAKTNQDLE